ncbi:EAL domain-containing protein [Rhodopseudomonas sp. P2A-2r]|uniref:bifunctional diguanylate cyclase/phosphodiesterase n=1 Tax=Rhodopseudomonas sp. P2A-2r TaxID=2991972 RepID=UPI002234B229|nr:EAL domain-containing protein [Rhodopseudomonas sp. P2A-2r]UZE49162.1 EAL domain-containing protein [Rhodopseudomonas sp. P2A-2r]
MISQQVKQQADDPLTRRNSVRWLVITGSILIAIIAGSTAVAIDTFRDRAMQSHQRELENALVLLTRHYEQEFADLERIEKDLSATMRIAGIDSPADFTRQMGSYETHLALKGKINRKATGTINLIGADGWYLNWTSSWPAPKLNVSDRSYFQELTKSLPGSDEEFVQGTVSRITGDWRLVFARRLNGPNGEFLGVVSRAMQPWQFVNFLASISLGKDSVFAVWHEDGTLLARYPQKEGLDGYKVKNQIILDHLKANSEPLTTINVSAVDHQERLTSIRRLNGFPLGLMASIPVDAALADWREQTKLMISAAAAAALIIVSMLFLIIRQIRRQHRAAQTLVTREKQRLDTAINNMNQGLLMFDADARAVVVNQSYLDMYHLPANAIPPGTSFRDAIRHHETNGVFQEGDVDSKCVVLVEEFKKRRAVTVDLHDGRVVHVLSQPIAGGGWVTTHEDITERHRVEERIAHLAHYDTLTDLPNRTLFHELLTQELGWVARGKQCAVIYIDMDEFKSINDSLGHPVGDALLKAVAQRLQGCVRSFDVVARLGGDEFAIVQTDLGDRDETIALVNRIYESIREPFECLGHRLLTDASIGVALAPQDGADIDQLLKNADLAMYSAKADGRRTYRFFEPEMDARIQGRRILEQELHEAIAGGNLTKGGFEVQYQPLLRLSDDAISGCEALLRWRHPVRGMISPAEFIPVAEEIGVIDKIGEWVLDTACREAANWPDDIKISVNVSPVQFRSRTLALKVASVLDRSGLRPQRLELEITEAVLISDDEAALDMLHRLRALGVRIALDDFGTGYSSLSYLHRFPFDKIKIDRCFVTDIAEVNGSPAIVQAVVNIAASRNMTTTAEGVETEAQKQLLRTLGCTEMQGWLFGAALPAAEIRALIARHRGDAAAAQASDFRLKPMAYLAIFAPRAPGTILNEP